MAWAKVALVGLAALLAAWLVLWFVGQWRWQGQTAALQSAMAAVGMPLANRHYDPAMIDSLPAPVQRYLGAVLVPGQPMVQGVRMAHSGMFNTGEVKDSWKPFVSEQMVQIARPGLVWTGSVQVAPGLPVRVHDAYVAGEGVLVPAILGLFKLTELRGGGEIASGELMRWLAEAPWYPTALLPGNGVTWTAIDERSARAVVTDGGVSVGLTFRFGADDLITAVQSEARGRMVAGVMVPTPWEGRWTDYARVAGMLVPMAGEVAWVLPGGQKPYWRGRVTTLVYETGG